VFADLPSSHRFVVITNFVLFFSTGEELLFRKL
jgi:hypothetical protein